MFDEWESSYHGFKGKGGNPQIVKNIGKNFLILTAVHRKVYIAGMGMSQRIHFGIRNVVQ